MRYLGYQNELTRKLGEEDKKEKYRIGGEGGKGIRVEKGRRDTDQKGG